MPHSAHAQYYGGGYGYDDGGYYGYSSGCCYNYVPFNPYGTYLGGWYDYRNTTYSIYVPVSPYIHYDPQPPVYKKYYGHRNRNWH